MWYKPVGRCFLFTSRNTGICKYTVKKVTPVSLFKIIFDATDEIEKKNTTIAPYVLN